MGDESYLGMRPGDLADKPYAKYWNPEMAPLPEHAAQAILTRPEAAELGFAHDEAGQLLEPGYLPLETGYTRLANGQVFVAVLTRMPGVSGEMIDWWFAWHGVEKERYKLWHPRAHLANGTSDGMKKIVRNTGRAKILQLSINASTKASTVPSGKAIIA